MKLTGCTFTTVSVPFTEPEFWRWGRTDGLTNILIELTTDDGITGLGEAIGDPSTRVVRSFLEDAWDLVRGRDPFDIAPIVQLFDHRMGAHHFAHASYCATAGIEMALWDIVGKAVGQPLYRLFGGPFRHAIPFYYYIPIGAHQSMAERAVAAVAQGFSTIYLKIGFDADGDVGAVRAIREALGDGPHIRVDANEAWSPGEARQIMRRLAPYDVEFVEQPVSMNNLPAMAYLRTCSDVAIGANQSAWTLEDVLAVIHHGAADVIVTDQHQLGGLLRFKQAAAIAAAAGLPIIKHSYGDLGISTFAAIHVMASAPNFTMANQTFFQYLVDDVIIGGVTPFTDGCLPLPDGPGIGVALDPDRVAKYAQLYEQQGAFSTYTDYVASYQ